MLRPPLLIFVFLLTIMCGAAAAAGLDPAHMAAVDRAAAAFLAMAKDAYQSGNPPREADPVVKPLLDTVFGTAGLNSSGPLPFAQLGSLNDWTVRVVAVGSVYVFAATGIPDFEHLTSLDEKQEQQIVRNTVAFAPEIGRYFDAELAIEQAMIECILAELAADPPTYQSQSARHGLETTRGGVKQTLTGVMTTLLTPGIDRQWVRARLPALTAIAPIAAKFLSAQDRSELRDIAAEVAERIDDPTAAAGLGAIAGVFGS